VPSRQAIERLASGQQPLLGRAASDEPVETRPAREPRVGAGSPEGWGGAGIGTVGGRNNQGGRGSAHGFTLGGTDKSKLSVVLTKRLRTPRQ